MESNKICIVSAGIGGWYSRGLDRLEKSLNYHGFAGDWLCFRELPPGSPSHSLNPYAFKIYVIQEVIKMDYTHVLWLDASFWAIKDPMPVFDYINSVGLFTFPTGYNLAQSCNDRILEYAGITRDEAELIPEHASGAVGFNFTNPLHVKIFERWSEYMEAGMFKGSRNHDKQSSDPRFLHHRQDQSALSLVLHENGLLPPVTDFVAYYKTGHDPEKCVFFIRGL